MTIDLMVKFKDINKDEYFIPIASQIEFDKLWEPLCLKFKLDLLVLMGTAGIDFVKYPESISELISELHKLQNSLLSDIVEINNEYIKYLNIQSEELIKYLNMIQQNISNISEAYLG
jgi:hypothetical protein